MCHFFRFTIREWLWLTLVVAVMLAWFVREGQHREALQSEAAKAQAKLDQANNRASKWRLAAGGFEDYFITCQMTADWQWQSGEVILQNSGSIIHIPLNSHEPTGPGPD
jgi:hypothetical protein